MFNFVSLADTRSKPQQMLRGRLGKRMWHGTLVLATTWFTATVAHGFTLRSVGYRQGPPIPAFGGNFSLRVVGPLYGQPFHGLGISTFIVNGQGRVVGGTFAYALVNGNAPAGVLTGFIVPTANPSISRLVVGPFSSTGIFSGAGGFGFAQVLSQSNVVIVSQVDFTPIKFPPFVFGN